MDEVHRRIASHAHTCAKVNMFFQHFTTFVTFFTFMIKHVLRWILTSQLRVLIHSTTTTFHHLHVPPPPRSTISTALRFDALISSRFLWPYTVSSFIYPSIVVWPWVTFEKAFFLVSCKRFCILYFIFLSSCDIVWPYLARVWVHKFYCKNQDEQYLM